MSVRVEMPTQAVEDAVKWAENVKAFLSRLDETWSVDFHIPDAPRSPPRTLRGVATGRQPTIVEVIGYMQRGFGPRPPRDPFVVSPSARQWLFARVAGPYLEGAATVPEFTAQSVYQRIAFALRDLAVERLERGGADLEWQPLAARTVSRKAALGYPTHAGQMTSQTIQALRRALPTVRRAG